MPAREQQYGQTVRPHQGLRRIAVMLLATLWVLPSVNAARVQSVGYRIPRLRGITLDGRAHDWPDNAFRVAVMHRQRRGSAQGHPSGDVDLRLGWTDEGLCVLLKVADDKHIETDKIWKLDAVELFVAEEPGSEVYYQAVIAPGLAPDYPNLRWQIYDHCPRENGKLSLDACRGRTSRGYILEAILPWPTPGFVPQKGQSPGFQIIVNDADTSRERWHVVHTSWYPDRKTYKDTGKMHRLVLDENADVPLVSNLAFHPLASPPRLEVHTLAQYAGLVLTAIQDGKELARVALARRTQRGLTSATVTLPDVNPHGAPVELRAGRISVGRLRLYREPAAHVRRLIENASRTADEKERYRLLQLVGAESPDSALQADLAKLMPVVDMWANGREKAIAGELASPSDYLAAVVSPTTPPDIRADSPLYPLFCLYRARHLIWTPIQYGWMARDPEVRESYYGTARNLLKRARAAVPDNPLINMYLGLSIAWPADAAPHPDAPEWANQQREALDKLSDIVHWWIDERQSPRGYYGGGWNDDVEMWRLWTPVIIGFQDPKVTAAQEKLSRYILSQDHMKPGYSLRSQDVEHSSEESADTVTPMMHLQPGAREWRVRARRHADLFRDVWSGINERGYRQFKSVVFNAVRTSSKPRHAVDTVYHPRAVQPALLHWQRTADPELTALFSDWLRGWVEASARTERGKPAGLVPSAIRWPDGTVGGTGADWWRPEAYKDTTLYDWPSSMSMMLNCFLLAYKQTGEERYLEPLRSIARIRADFLERYPDAADATVVIGTARVVPEGATDNFVPGSRDWCASLMAPILAGPLAKYRFLTGDDAFDDLLRRDASGYIRFRLDGMRDALTADLTRAADAFRVNRPCYTSEVRWTDRLFRAPQRYFAHYADPKPSNPDYRLLYTTVTGDPGDPLYFPLNAVRWLTPAQDIAVLVTDAGTRHLSAELFHFGSAPRDMGAEFHRLAPGSYTIRLREKESGRQVLQRDIDVSAPGTRTRFTLPAEKLCHMEVYDRKPN